MIKTYIDSFATLRPLWPSDMAIFTTPKMTGDGCVRKLKEVGLSITARGLANRFGHSDSRAIATALRKPVADGRVSCTYKKGIAWYRFKRLTPKK